MSDVRPDVEFKVIDEFGRNDRRKVIGHQSREFTHRARMATILIEKWGLVAGEPGGEDSAGRAKLKLMEPAEIVSRACTTADLAYSEFEKRGWFVETPTLAEIYPNPDETAR